MVVFLPYDEGGPPSHVLISRVHGFCSGAAHSNVPKSPFLSNQFDEGIGGAPNIPESTSQKASHKNNSQ